MHHSYTILEWPILGPSGPEVVQPEPKAEPVTPLRVAVPIEVAAEDPKYALLFPRVKRPTERTRS